MPVESCAFSPDQSIVQTSSLLLFAGSPATRISVWSRLALLRLTSTLGPTTMDGAARGGADRWPTAMANGETMARRIARRPVTTGMTEAPKSVSGILRGLARRRKPALNKGDATPYKG